MTILGIIHDGELITKEITPYRERFRDSKHKVVERTITENEQILALYKRGWKPVEEVDETQLLCDEGYVVGITPFECDNKISFKYEKVVDSSYITNQINALKEQLSGSDYKVTKCYEAALVGNDLPYDMQQLHKERQTLRDEINNLKTKM